MGAVLAPGGVARADTATAPQFTSAKHIAIVLSDNAGETEQAAAKELVRRLTFRSDAVVEIGTAESAADLHIFLGIAGRNTAYDSLAALYALEPPRRGHYFAEGYAAKTVLLEERPAILTAAADERGVLYAAGEIVRQARPAPDAVAFRAFDIQTAPAYRFRGFSPNQGGSMVKNTGARGWTADEQQERMFDSIFAGANAFYAGRYENDHYRLLRSLSLMTVTDARPNHYFTEFPDAWRAGKREAWEGDTWICPSIPEARAALLEQWREDFAKRPAHDIMRFYAGDPGGCKDDRCEPWGRTFVELCAEMAAIWHEFHPDSKIFIANQDLDNLGDQLIFEYLRAEPREWLYALCYAPGTNAMSRYFRDELREDLFEYPGAGPVNRYLAYTLHQLPPEQTIVHFSDITHWISAQYMVENPDVYLQKSFGRRTFHARPKAYYDIFQAIMPFSEGDIIYSEGHHDEFHQYLWARLLWNPQISLDALLMEYCTLYFGEAAARPMAEALLQLEKNLEVPLAENEGIARYAALVAEAGEAMPDYWKDRNYRWLLHQQKAVLDQYVQHRLRRELDQEQRVRAQLEQGLESGALADAARNALAIAEEPAESEQMAAWREEAGRLGDASNALFGVRNIGYARIGQSLRDMEGLKEALSAILAADPADQAALARAAIEVTEKPASRGRIFW